MGDRLEALEIPFWIMELGHKLLAKILDVGCVKIRTEYLLK